MEEAKGSKVQANPGLYNEFKTSVSYVIPNLEKH